MIASYFNRLGCSIQEQAQAIDFDEICSQQRLIDEATLSLQARALKVSQ
jgi:hypothetical protein